MKYVKTYFDSVNFTGFEEIAYKKIQSFSKYKFILERFLLSILTFLLALVFFKENQVFINDKVLFAVCAVCAVCAILGYMMFEVVHSTLKDVSFQYRKYCLDTQYFRLRPTEKNEFLKSLMLDRENIMQDILISNESEKLELEDIEKVLVSGEISLDLKNKYAIDSSEITKCVQDSKLGVFLLKRSESLKEKIDEIKILNNSRSSFAKESFNTIINVISQHRMRLIGN